MCLSGSLSSPVLASGFSDCYENGRSSSLRFLLVWIKVRMKSRDKREMLVMVTVTFYKWTPVMHSYNKFRELFCCSVFMLFDGQTTQGEYNRKNTWEVTAGCVDTKTALHCDFLRKMGHPFLPSCTLSNLNWNENTGVESALCSANLNPQTARGGGLVWHLCLVWHAPGTMQPQERKENRCFLKRSCKKPTAFLSILWNCWKQLNTSFKWVWQPTYKPRIWNIFASCQTNGGVAN